MSNKMAKLAAAFERHISLPWTGGLAAVQRIIFAIYDKVDELRLRAYIEEFAGITRESGRKWLLLDITDEFPRWLASQEYRDAYFECPEDLTGYPNGEVVEFVSALTMVLKQRINTEADAETVVGLVGVGSLFGLARASTVIEGIKESVTGRLLVFFPGEYQPENHSYRLLDARDGWNYLAVPLLAQE